MKAMHVNRVPLSHFYHTVTELEQHSPNWFTAAFKSSCFKRSRHPHRQNPCFYSTTALSQTLQTFEGPDMAHATMYAQLP